MPTKEAGRREGRKRIQGTTHCNNSTDRQQQHPVGRVPFLLLPMSTKKRELKERLSRSIVRTLQHLNPGAAKVQSPEFHYEIDRRARNLDVERINNVAPRGHAKSTLMVVGMTLWHIFLEPIYRELTGKLVRYDEDNDHRDYEAAYVLLISKTQKDAKKRLRELKYVLGDKDSGKQSKRLKALFGDWGEETALKWRDDMIILKDGTVVQAVGTGQNVHGLKEGNTRPTLIIVDDPENEENTKTPEAKQSNMKWLFQGIIPSLDPQVGRALVIGTPIDTSCMVVNLHNSWVDPDKQDCDSIWFQNDKEREISRWSVSEDGDLEDRLKPNEHIEEDDNGRWLVKPQLLWPAWFGREKLEAKYQDIKDTDGISVGVYFRMYECKVVGDEEQIFRPSFFKYTWVGSLLYDDMGNPYLRILALHGHKLDEPEILPVSITTGIDPAYSTSARSDRTAIVNIATAPDDRIFELEGVYRKIEPTMLLNIIERNAEEFEPRRTMMEANGPQKFVYEQVVTETSVRCIPDAAANQQAKKGEGGRIHQLQPFMAPTENDDGEILETPRFHHRRESPLKQELLSYPRGKDDYADACEKAVRIRTRPHHEVVLEGGGPSPTSRRRPLQDPMLS